ncbi:hypothetical protein NUW54_g9912 [Trametes sanguinea]|uniref:Uncharacterized protein n=1 Tax=Trametes sanguinea TaxID=158606 RepID=A0ACC1P599_9APHY|nr:hypothetical protein NUW54_g9912 [Trametes sanguinea]
MGVLTWTHVEGAAAAKVDAQTGPGGQAPVAVEDALLVRSGDGVNDLEEGPADRLVVVCEGRAVDDGVEEVPAVAQVHNEEDVELFLDDRVEGDHVRMPGERAVVHDLALLLSCELRAALIPEHALDRVVLRAMRPRCEVFGEVDDAIRAVPQLLAKPEVERAFSDQDAQPFGVVSACARLGSQDELARLSLLQSDPVRPDRNPTRTRDDVSRRQTRRRRAGEGLAPADVATLHRGCRSTIDGSEIHLNADVHDLNPAAEWLR